MATATVLAKWTRIGVGTVWAGLVFLVGLWLLRLRQSTPDPYWSGIELWGGLAAVSAGEYVFLCVAADRLCPMTNRRLPDTLELSLAAVCAGCLVGCVVTLLGGPK